MTKTVIRDFSMPFPKVKTSYWLTESHRTKLAEAARVYRTGETQVLRWLIQDLEPKVLGGDPPKADRSDDPTPYSIYVAPEDKRKVNQVADLSGWNSSDVIRSLIERMKIPKKILRIELAPDLERERKARRH